MDPQDHLRELLDGIGCTVCEERVPGDRIRLLARREDLVFLQVDCAACGSAALGFIADEAVLARIDERTDATNAGTGASPISSDDVLDMHTLLSSWTGDLASLVHAEGRSGRDAGSRTPGAGRPG
jgi:hypothetical protein